jgi:hypothetical protein
MVYYMIYSRNRFFKTNYFLLLLRFIRTGFDQPLTEVEFLRRRLAEEQANVEAANQAKEEAESRYRLAEKERDVYRVLARTLRTRLISTLREESHDAETIEEAAAAMLFGGMESLSPFGLGRMLRHLRAHPAGGNDEEMGEEGDEHFEHMEDEDGMSEDTDDSEEDEEDSDDDDDDDDDDDESLSIASDHQDSIIEDDPMISKNRRAQVRTISLSEEDL